MMISVCALGCAKSRPGGDTEIQRTTASVTPSPSTPPAIASVSASPTAAPSAELSDVAGEPSRGWPEGYVPNLIRDRAEVRIGAVTETWVLRWKSPPDSACFTKAGRASALCIGLTGGAERGPLELVRTRDGVDVASLDLGDVLGEQGKVVLPRYPGEVRHSARGLTAAPPIQLLLPTDTNQDGVAAEFILPGRYRPWGERAAYLVGFSPANGKPFAFHADRASIWAQVSAMTDSLEIITLPCLDHGSPDEQVDLFLKTPSGVTREMRRYPCRPGTSGKIVRGTATILEPATALGW